MSLPLMFDGGHIDDNAAARVGTFTQTYRYNIAWYPKICHRCRKVEGIGWNNADITLHVDETALI